MIHYIKIQAGTNLSDMAILSQLTLINIVLGRGNEVVMTIDKSISIINFVKQLLEKNYEFTLVKSKESDVVEITFPKQNL